MAASMRACLSAVGCARLVRDRVQFAVRRCLLRCCIGIHLLSGTSTTLIMALAVLQDPHTSFRNSPCPVSRLFTDRLCPFLAPPSPLFLVNSAILLCLLVRRVVWQFLLPLCPGSNNVSFFRFADDTPLVLFSNGALVLSKEAQEQVLPLASNIRQMQYSRWLRRNTKYVLFLACALLY